MTKKNNLFILKWIATLILVIFFIRYVDNADTTVVRKGVVEKVENEIIEIVDNSGNVWEWKQEEKENFTKNQKVKLIMNNNHTEDTIEDDIIIKIKPL